MPASNPSPPADASGTMRGLLNFVAQTIAGVKTFTSAAIFSAGIQLALLFNTIGSGASDVVLKAGTTLADASVHATAKIFSVRTGIGGTEVEQASITKAGTLSLAGGLVVNGYPASSITCSGSWIDVGSGIPVRTNSYFAASTPTGSTAYYASAGGAFSGLATMTLWSETISAADAICLRSGAYTADGSVNAAAILQAWGTGLSGAGVFKAYLRASGRFDQRGVNSATVGADTQNQPTGINILASGATSVTITNSLVTTTSRVNVTFHADPGGRYWVTRAAGSFTVTVSAAPGANAAFSWEVSSLV